MAGTAMPQNRPKGGGYPRYLNRKSRLRNASGREKPAAPKGKKLTITAFPAPPNRGDAGKGAISEELMVYPARK
jgi:hypothetical protein